MGGVTVEKKDGRSEFRKYWRREKGGDNLKVNGWSKCKVGNRLIRPGGGANLEAEKGGAIEKEGEMGGDTKVDCGKGRS